MLDTPSSNDVELQALRERYSRRTLQDERYDLFNSAALLAMQERQRCLVRLLRDVGIRRPDGLDLLEVGSGTGGNLLELLRLGFSPDRLSGIELLDDRHRLARERLPAAVRLIHGDAISAPLGVASRDLVLAATVFSSLLDDGVQQQLADAMWHCVKPGGGLLVYDFIYDNPGNPDVRGVPLRRIRALFSQASVASRRVTLAPPLARRACRLHPALYGVCNAVPWLRTHVLCWIQKPHD